MIDGGNEDYKIIMMMIKWQDSTPNRFGFYIIKLYGRLMTCDALYEAAVIQSVSDGWPGTRSGWGREGSTDDDEPKPQVP